MSETLESLRARLAAQEDQEGRPPMSTAGVLAALAEAEARGRLAGLEEAAREVEHPINVACFGECCERRRELAGDIRALAEQPGGRA